ncbi:OX-2 membrane glyco -like protein [Labeo rohita]|uniref:OX-2 membrane glyco-like protein n=1 Tax=Labeo rohita TaxID=84645 RepID=A0A498L3L5_LABRO|nr:OX-2 membrane glyco -like protein [Labeo rohita]
MSKTSYESGTVLAPSHLQAIAGLPFMLACNITMEAGEVLKQVLWEDMTNTTILHYQPGGYVTKEDGVELSQQTTAMVEMIDNKTVVSGQTATLSCEYILTKQVRQVLWKKTAEQGDTATVASYVINDRPIIESPFKDRITLNPSFGLSKLSIHQAQTEDEGCYTCEFHTYPHGIKSDTACLSVYVLPKPEASYITVSQGIVEANCSAVSRPVAEISWNVEGHNQTLGPAVTSFYQLGDGTTMVVSSIQMQSELLDDELVKCEVRHQGLETAIYVTLNKSRKVHLVLISASCVALVLLICLCICLKRC